MISEKIVGLITGLSPADGVFASSLLAEQVLIKLDEENLSFEKSLNISRD